MVSSALPLRRTSSRFISFFQILYGLLLGLIDLLTPESFKYHDISGQTVLITGAGSGIGQLMTLNFLKQGCKVVLLDVNTAGLNQTVSMARKANLDTSKIVCYTINLCNREAIYETAKKVQTEVGFVDILVNNAGVVSGRHFLDTPDEKIQLTFDVNTLAHFWTVKAFLPEMVNRNSGHLVTIASVAGNAACSGLVDYCASKFANVGFDLALRLELAQANLTGIHTSIVKPYFITTGMFDGSKSDIVPFLEPQYVANRIVSGVRARTPEIIIPYYLVVLFQLGQLLPSKALIAVIDFLGGFEAMSHFKGREGQPLAEDNNNQSGNGKKVN